MTCSIDMLATWLNAWIDNTANTNALTGACSFADSTETKYQAPRWNWSLLNYGNDWSEGEWTKRIVLV